MLLQIIPDNKAGKIKLCTKDYSKNMVTTEMKGIKLYLETLDRLFIT